MLSSASGFRILLHTSCQTVKCKIPHQLKNVQETQLWLRAIYIDVDMTKNEEKVSNVYSYQTSTNLMQILKPNKKQQIVTTVETVCLEVNVTHFMRSDVF